MDSTAIETLDREGNGIRIEFEWRDDRFHHAIYGVYRGQAILLGQSIEGDAINPWPPSPPLQQLHKQQSDSGEILFLTGMAGRSHWSGSVSTAIDHLGPEVMFDFACRHRMKPEWLGVTYRLAGGVEAEVIGDGVRVRIQALEWSIRADCVSASDGALAIAAQSSVQGNTANTSRWAYAVQAIEKE